MMGEILYFAHRHFRTILLVATVAILALAGLGFLDSQEF